MWCSFVVGTLALEMFCTVLVYVIYLCSVKSKQSFQIRPVNFSYIYNCSKVYCVVLIDRI